MIQPRPHDFKKPPNTVSQDWREEPVPPPIELRSDLEWCHIIVLIPCILVVGYVIGESTYRIFCSLGIHEKMGRPIIAVFLLSAAVCLTWRMYKGIKENELIPRESEEKRLADRMKLWEGQHE